MENTKNFKPAIILKVLVVAFIIIVFSICFLGYRLLYSPDFLNDKTVYVYIDRTTDFEKLCSDLVVSAGCKRINDFIFLAEKLHYSENLKTGRYAVESGMNHLNLLNRLRRGQQTAINITFNNVRLQNDLAERLDEQLMIGKGEIISLLKDSGVCKGYGFDVETVKALFIPNTYEVYWNISAENLMQRMKREYDAFWNDERKKKAKAAGLTPLQVSILASIVEEESAVVDEYPVIAGLYINRLKRGMLLQADPTLKYSLGDFSIRRVLDRHKEIDSPYNTYKHAGLTPGPIRIPSINAIDGTLNFMRHKYLYMCAKGDYSGRHNFAVTLAEHNRNAAQYHSELNRRRIR